MRTCMIVRELLEVLDLTNINDYTINDRVLSLNTIKENYNDYTIKRLSFLVMLNNLQLRDIKSTINIPEELNEFVEEITAYHNLPQNSYVIKLILNIYI